MIRNLAILAGLIIILYFSKLSKIDFLDISSGIFLGGIMSAVAYPSTSEQEF